MNTESSFDQNNREDITGYLLKYLRYWYIYLITLVVSFASGAFINWYTTPVYQMDCSLLIKDEKMGGANDLLKELNLFQTSRNVENEIQLLRSRTLVKKAIDKLNINVSYLWIGDIKAHELYKNSPISINFDSTSILESKIKYN